MDGVQKTAPGGPTKEHRLRVRLPLEMDTILACITLFTVQSKTGGEIHVDLAASSPTTFDNAEIRMATAELLQGLAQQILDSVAGH